MKPLLLVLLFACCLFTHVNAQTKTKSKHTNISKPLIKYGTASYYAKKFDKRRTASGELYHADKYSAACNVLPLGTWVKVTNLKNNRSVVLKVNDRLNPKNKRLVDLSWVAARELGYIGRGLAHVKVEVMRDFHLARD